MSDRNFWGGSDMVFQCLIDRPRAKILKKVIDDCVKKGDIVVDLGTGTGILAMFAAEAGAKKVYAIEADQNLFNSLELNLIHNKYSEKIELIKGDATTILLPEKADVVICEMVATGLIDESQVPAMNNVQKFLKKGSKIIPSTIENFADLVYIENNFYGHKMEVIQYEYIWDKKIRSKSKSNKFMYKKIHFNEINNLEIDEEIEFKIKSKGKINGLRITNLVTFPNGIKIEKTAAFCMPMIIPIDEISAEKGDQYTARIKYKMCEGFNHFEFDLKKLS